MSQTPLLFNGTELGWTGHGTFKATSGNLYKDPKSGITYDFQAANYQEISDFGPIPEGSYRFLAVVAKGSAFNARGALDGRQGIESLAPEGSNMATPTGWKHSQDATAVIADWGHNRVRLDILHIDHRKARRRDGFYLHDSHKGHTHGCIEVAHAFFDQLRSFAADQAKLGKHGVRWLKLTVKYPSDTASTNGKTQF